jgi:hypothetical protein
MLKDRNPYHYSAYDSGIQVDPNALPASNLLLKHLTLSGAASPSKPKKS